MESCLTELGKICMEKLVDRALAELRHVFCFTCIANEFQKEKLRLEPEIKTLEQLVKVAAGRGNDIKANADSWKKKADKLIQEDIETKQTCFFGLCPDCIWRYKKGKELANYTQEIKQLIAEKHDNIELPRRLPDVERYSSKDYISLQSRESKYEELLDALKDENNYMIGLHGMGGIGKTTLAKEVGKALQLSEQFSQVIVTTVSFTPDTKKIQDDIAGSLELKWEDCNDSDRPKKLWSRLTNGEKVLLIMDDVWDQGPPLDFDLIGIPKQDNHKGCRVLITTRSKRILNKMDCKKMIELGLLSEEDAWTMFKTYAGIENSSSKDVITKGRKISKECKQLPVAIALVASSLRGQQDRKHEWDATLKCLKKPVLMDGVDDEMVGVYKCLKFSYDCMKNEQAKGLFLLSSVFPEDEEIPSELLTRLGIGMGLFGEDYGSYDDARIQLIRAKNKLIDSSLLIGVDEERVKMHDLVHEVAQWIANKEIQYVNLSNKDQKSSLEREKNIKYLFCKGKDMDLFSCKYDGSKLKILIVVVEHDEGLKCMEVPNSFFENIGKLQVLWLFSDLDKRLLSLSDSIHSLTNIRSIYFRKVDLGDISVLGNLQSLETLDLVKCTIDELPSEIARLGRFKLLNLGECEIRRNDPFEVIERCSTLEELYFIRSFNDFCREITLPKLQRYRISKGWCRFHDSLSKYVCFKEDEDDECFFSKETFKYCMQTSEGLELDSINEGWRNLMPEIVPVDQGMKDLVNLRLSSISQLQCLVDTTGSQVPIVLSKLKKLYLEGMENLEELFNGSISFDSLKNLKRLEIKECKMFQRLFNCELNLCDLKSVTLTKCPMLVNLFPLLTSRSLVLLEKLEIDECEGLENIVIDDGDKSHGPMFPKLRYLDVIGCDRLESIFPFLSFEDFPVLEVIDITGCDKLEYIFGQYQHVELSSLKKIILDELPNFIGIFPEYSHSMSSHVNDSSSTSRDGSKAQTQVDPIKCNILSWSCVCCHGINYRNKYGSMSTTKVPSVNENPVQHNTSASVSSSHPLQILERAQCLSVQSHIMCNIKEMTLSGFSKIKSVFMLSITSRMLVETLKIENCDELKYIGDDDSGGNNWDNVFPNLKTLEVNNCKELEYIFGHNTDVHQNHTKIYLHLPTLECLELVDLQSFVAMCPKQYSTTFPRLRILHIKSCPLDAIKSIGECITNHSVSKYLDSTITKELSGSMDHFNALEHLMLHDLNDMMGLFVGPKNSFSLQNLKSVKIVGCEILEIVFSNSISTCLSQLTSLIIKECKELKHIIEDDTSNSLASRTLFPKLKTLVVIKCHKLKCVFPVSICKEFPKLECLMISEADEFEEIFKSKSDQKIEIPNLNIVAFLNLPCLFHTQGDLFHAAKNRFVRNCQVSWTSASTPLVHREIDDYLKGIDYETFCLLSNLRYQLENETKGIANPSAKTTKDIAVGNGIEVEATLGHKLTSSQLQMKQTLEAGSEFFENASDLETPSVAILPTNTKKLENEQSTSQQGLGVEKEMTLTNAKTVTASTHLELVCSSQMSKQDVDVRDSLEAVKLNDDQDFQTREHFEISFQQLEDETTKDIVVGVEIEVEAALGHKLTSSQCLKETNYQSIKEGYSFKTTSSETMCSVSNIRNEQPIQLVSPKLKGVEEGTALTNAKTITTSTLSKSVSSSQVQDTGVRDSLETTKINDDQVSLNEDVVMKEMPIIEEQFSKGDEFSVLKSKPSPSSSVPMPLAFQAPSMHFEGNPSQKVEDLSSPYHITRKLEELVSKKHLDYENLSLLIDFLVKHPSVLLSDKLSNAYKGYAYKFLTKLLKFLQTHSVLDVLGSSHSEFVELLHDVRSFSFDKDWLDDVEKRALFPDLKFSQEALQNLLDSKKQITEDVEVVRFKIDILTQNVEELKQKLSSSEADLESIIQKEKEIVESKAALSAPLGY